jgi:hypothetical protein
MCKILSKKKAASEMLVFMIMNNSYTGLYIPNIVFTRFGNAQKPKLYLQCPSLIAKKWKVFIHAKK